MTKEKPLIEEIEERYMKEKNVDLVGTINQDAWGFAIKIFNERVEMLEEILYGICDKIGVCTKADIKWKIEDVFNSQQDIFVNLDSGKSKHDLKEKGSERGTSADLTSNARGLEEADEDTSRSLAADNSSKKGCGKEIGIIYDDGEEEIVRCGKHDYYGNQIFHNNCKEGEEA